MIVCFDVGEVLIDETRVWSIWARVLGVSPFTLQATIGARLSEGGSHLDALADVDPSWESRRAAFERALGGLQERDLYPDVLPTLRRLRDAGTRVAVCGNQPAARRADLLATGVRADPVLTSADLGAEKPDPAFFRALLDVLGDPDPAEVWYVGDRVDNDLAPAAEVGLRTAWVRRGPWARLLPAVRAGHAPAADVTVDDLGALVDALIGSR